MKKTLICSLTLSVALAACSHKEATVANSATVNVVDESNFSDAGKANDECPRKDGQPCK